MKRNYFIVILVLIIFFVISFLTNIMNSILEDIKDSFDLIDFFAGFFPLFFFIAYGVMSIPAGMLIERFKEKPIMVAAFILAFIGSLTFANVPVFIVALISLFLIGAGMALLQVAINPLLRSAGGEEHFAFFSVLGQLVFGSAAFLGPFVYKYLVLNLKDYSGGGNFLIDFLSKVVPTHIPWISLYWVFALVTLIMVVLMALVRLPKVERKEDERAGAWETHKKLFKNKYVILYFIGIFCYVGTEQGVGNWIKSFLVRYHNMDPKGAAVDAVGYFWLMLTIGCLLGLVLLKLFDCRRILKWFTSAAIICLGIAIAGNAKMAFYGFIMVGFFLSVMWSVIFSLALNSVEKHHGSFSGILCTGIIGGALVPPIVGGLGDLFGLRIGIMFNFVTLAYILGIGFWAKPLIDNATILRKKEKKQEIK
jgi:FHS family L-fucose permease-like MFS transporter